MSYYIYHCCVYSEKTSGDGKRNCPKHAEFYSKNKFEKLVHLDSFIIRIQKIRCLKEILLRNVTDRLMTVKGLRLMTRTCKLLRIAYTVTTYSRQNGSCIYNCQVCVVWKWYSYALKLMHKGHGDKIIISYFEIILKLWTSHVNLFGFINEQPIIRFRKKKTTRLCLNTLYSLYDLV